MAPHEPAACTLDCFRLKLSRADSQKVTDDGETLKCAVTGLVSLPYLMVHGSAHDDSSRRRGAASWPCFAGSHSHAMKTPRNARCGGVRVKAVVKKELLYISRIRLSKFKTEKAAAASLKAKRGGWLREKLVEERASAVL